jgi:hypothetical protein
MSGRSVPLPPRASLTIALARDRCAPLAELTLAGTARLAARIAGALTIAVFLVALTVRLALAARARHWLAFPFTGIPSRPAEAASIFLHNLRALSAIGGLLLVAQSPHWNTGDRQPGPIQRMLQRVGEALLAAAVAANVIVIGASLGAYGPPMVSAALPHGPVELTAYALALALYLQGRHRRLPMGHIVVVGSLSVATLALASLLETFVNV